MDKSDVKKMKPSAYKSMMMKKFGLNKEQSTPQETRDLVRWKNEKWQNLTAKLTDNKFYACGSKGKKQKELGLPSICRPSKKVNEKTPMPLAVSYSTAQIKKAIDIKKQGKTIKWKDL